MTDLSQFSASETELLISLPYRAGILVSNADDVDGEQDDEREQEALAETLRAVCDLHRDKVLLHAILKQTLQMKFEWPRWAERAFKIEDDAKNAINLLVAKAGKEDARAYRAAVMEIAGTVARAYGEFSQFDVSDQRPGLFKGLIENIVSHLSGLSHEDNDHPMNISAAEDRALSGLSDALRV